MIETIYIENAFRCYMWQDKVISVVGLLFGFMLIPMVIDSLNGITVNIVSSSLTAIGLFIMAGCFWTMKLKLSFISNLITATMWTILFVIAIM